MTNNVVSLALARLERQGRTGETDALPVAGRAHPGAVELTIGHADDAVELHLSPDEAKDLAELIWRLAQEATCLG